MGMGRCEVIERPEQQGRAYEVDGDPDARNEFTPWRPGDPSTAGEAPMSAADAVVQGRRWTPPPTADRGEPAEHLPQEQAQSCRSWWTEQVTRQYDAGDRVRSERAVGNGLFATVQPGTPGEVISTRSGLFGDKFATVQFENGYTEEVRAEHLERRGWLD